MTALTTPMSTGRRNRLELRAAGSAVLGAAAAATALWLLAVPLLGLDVRVAMAGAEQAVGIGAVVGASAAAGIVATVLLGVLARTVRRPVRTWRVVALVVLAVSLGGPLSSGANTASVAVLTALHLVVAAVLVPVLPRAVSER